MGLTAYRNPGQRIAITHSGARLTITYRGLNLVTGAAEVEFDDPERAFEVSRPRFAIRIVRHDETLTVRFSPTRRGGGKFILDGPRSFHIDREATAP